MIYLISILLPLLSLFLSGRAAAESFEAPNRNDAYQNKHKNALSYLNAMKKSLKDNDLIEYNKSMNALILSGKDSVPSLRYALKSQNPELRNLSIKVLNRLGPDGADAIPDLLAILLSGDNNRNVCEASEALPSVAWANWKVIVPTLIQGMQKETNLDRLGAISRTLGYFRMRSLLAVPHLKKIVANDQIGYAYRTISLDSIVMIIEKRPVLIAYLENLLNSDHIAVSDRAVFYLSTFAGKYHINNSKIIKYAARVHSDAAIKALGVIGVNSSAAADMLISLLNNPKLKVNQGVFAREVIAESMGSIGVFNSKVLDALLKAIAKYNSAAACRTLGRFGNKAKSAIPTLLKVFRQEVDGKRPETDIRVAAVDALGRVVDNDKILEKILVEGMGDSFHMVRISSVQIMAFRKLNSKILIKLAKGLLNDRNPHVRIEAAISLLRVNESLPQSLAVLTHFIESHGKPGNEYAIMQIASSNISSTVIIDSLSKSLSNGITNERYYAAKTLAKIERLTPKSVQSLSAMLEYPDNEVALLCLIALIRHRHINEMVVNALLRQIKLRNCDAIHAVGNFGSVAKQFIPHLEKFSTILIQIAENLLVLQSKESLNHKMVRRIALSITAGFSSFPLCSCHIQIML